MKLFQDIVCQNSWPCESKKFKAFRAHFAQFVWREAWDVTLSLAKEFHCEKELWQKEIMMLLTKAPWDPTEADIISWNRILFMRAALKVMPPILLCWPMTSEADVGGTAVGVEPSPQYPVTFCCHERDSSRGDHLTKWQLTWKRVGKKWHPLTLINAFWTFMETKQWEWAQWDCGWCVSAVMAVTVGYLHWCSFTNIACRFLFISGKNT